MRFTYASVDRAPGIQVALPQTMMCLAERYAGAEARDQAGVDGLKALEEAGRPGRGAAGSSDSRGILHRVVETSNPFIHVGLHLGLGNVGLGRLGGDWCLGGARRVVLVISHLSIFQSTDVDYRQDK